MTHVTPKWDLQAGTIGLDSLGTWRQTGTGEQVRIWLRFLSGRRMDILQPSPFDFEDEDLARGGSREARWGGHTEGDHAFVVGQHVVEGLRLMRQRMPRPALTPQLELRFLLHDGSELLGMRDQLAPVKVLLGEAWTHVDSRLQGCIHRKYGLSERTPRSEETVVKRWDRIMAATEAVQLAGYGKHEVRRPRAVGGLGLDEDPDPYLRLEPWPARKVYEEFMGELDVVQKRLRLER